MKQLRETPASDASLAAMLVFPPEDQRRAWGAMFDHYVFRANGDPGEHLPAGARGVLAPASAADIARLRRDPIANLNDTTGNRTGPFA
ncbi:MAG: hypothetical protein WC692_10820 [Erythrobacter sp.]|jgi:hypothetical protein